MNIFNLLPRFNRTDEYTPSGKVYFFGLKYNSDSSWQLRGPMVMRDAKDLLRGQPYHRNNKNHIFYPDKGKMVRVPIKFTVIFEQEDETELFIDDGDTI